MDDFNDYQDFCTSTAVYPNKDTGNFIYPILGLCGEVGEIADKLKKVIRDDNGVITSERREVVKDELGDVLWYLARLSSELGFRLSDIAIRNIDKLTSRKDRGVLHGDGGRR